MARCAAASVPAGRCQPIHKRAPGLPHGHCIGRSNRLSAGRPWRTLHPASILGSHFGDRLSYGFLNLLGSLITKRSAKALKNLEVLIPLCIQLRQPFYVAGRDDARHRNPMLLHHKPNLAAKRPVNHLAPVPLRLRRRHRPRHRLTPTHHCPFPTCLGQYRSKVNTPHHQTLRHPAAPALAFIPVFSHLAQLSAPSFPMPPFVVSRTGVFGWPCRTTLTATKPPERLSLFRAPTFTRPPSSWRDLRSQPLSSPSQVS